MQEYKDKTFLYYFNSNSFVLKIPTILKLLIYLILNIFALFNEIYFLNILFALLLFFFLLLAGFVRYRIRLFKFLLLSLVLFFLLSFLLEALRSEVSLTDKNHLISTTIFIFEFFSKWLLINVSGLFVFTILSQEELISFLIKINLDFRIIISITIAFNLISRLLETVEEIDLSLKSRNLEGKNMKSIFNRLRYIFVSMLIDNIEYISSLRATYAFDYKEISENYEK